MTTCSYFFFFFNLTSGCTLSVVRQETESKKRGGKDKQLMRSGDQVGGADGARRPEGDRVIGRYRPRSSALELAGRNDLTFDAVCR